MSDYGYGDVEKVAKETSQNNKYLTLKDGVKHRLRIASRPMYSFRHFLKASADMPKGGYVPCEGKKDECKLCKAGNNKTAQWGWIVIDRAANYNDPETKDAVKVWKESQQPAFLIRDISELLDRNKQPVWGDPTTFDIIVKKKKKDNGAFGFDWTIEPDADHAQPLTDEEKKMVEDANYDLTKELANSKYSEHVGNYGGARPSDMETAPEEPHEGDVRPEDIPDDLGEPKKTKKEDEVDVDDIPF